MPNMVNLPQELHVEIFKHLGKYGFRYLGPAIVASKQTMEAVFSPEVLKDVDLSEFIGDPGMANAGSIYRSFFTTCVENSYVMGNHVEALRILCQDGPSEVAFAMLQQSHPNSIFAIFVTGIFRICAGDFEGGMETLTHIWDVVDAWEEAVYIADIMVQQIVRLGPLQQGLYTHSYNYPIEEVPHCTYIHCGADNVCSECFAFWYSLIVKSIC